MTSSVHYISICHNRVVNIAVSHILVLLNPNKSGVDASTNISQVVVNNLMVYTNRKQKYQTTNQGL